MAQSLPQAESHLPIEGHGIVGDLHTVALVGKNGTIDWCCMPSFDAPGIFGISLTGFTAETDGNFPQAFTHLALISACHALDEALNGA